MRDCFELMDFMMALLALALVMPLVTVLRPFSEALALTLLILAAAPLPVHIINLLTVSSGRWCLPEWAETILQWHAVVAGLVGLAGLAVMAVTKVGGWLFSGAALVTFGEGL